MRTAFLSLAAVAALAGSAGAHGLRTAFVEVTEIQPGHAVVHLRMNTPDPSIAVTSPDGDCALDATGDGGSVYDKTWLLECPDGLGGRSLALAGLGPIVGEGVVWIARADGTTASQIVRADAPGFALGRAAAPSALAVARQYIALGLEHILTGYDHLLFLLLLVLVLGEVRSVFLAETAFTLSHSLSFSATALGWIRVSAPAAETCIALSLVLLAAEVRTDAAPVAGGARSPRSCSASCMASASPPGCARSGCRSVPSAPRW